MSIPRDSAGFVRGRLTAEARLRSTGELLEGLGRVRNGVPANPEAWDRLLRQVRDEASPLATYRQTA